MGIGVVGRCPTGHRLKWAIRGLILVDTSMGRVPPVRWDERYVLAPVGSPHAPIIRRDLDRQCRRRALGTLGRCLAPSRGGRLWGHSSVGEKLHAKGQGGGWQKTPSFSPP